jgi:hypothetical protein
MSTLKLKSRESNIQKYIHKLIQENIPRKYKRAFLVTSLIYALDKSNKISDTTFKKILKLFEIGSVKENNLKYACYTRNYLWGELVNEVTINFDDRKIHLPEMIYLYKSCDEAFNLSVTEQLIDAIYNRIPDFMRYATEETTKRDLFNVLFFIKNKNRLVV